MFFGCQKYGSLILEPSPGIEFTEGKLYYFKFIRRGSGLFAFCYEDEPRKKLLGGARYNLDDAGNPRSFKLKIKPPQELVAEFDSIGSEER